jgi:hypothetical protein
MRLFASLLFTLAAISQAASAQEPPTRVGRLAFTEGTVALYQDPDIGWEKAYVNSPVTSENSIWTDPGSRAEMRVSGMAVRLDETTQLDIATLDENDLRAFLGRGSVAIRVRHFDNSERLDFATPHAQFRLYGNGRYRIDVEPDREETVLTVFTGSASMRSSSGDVKVAAGAAIRVRGGDSSFFVRERARTTAFDRWTLARDGKWIERRSTRYVSTDMTGYEDLDAYGEWYEEPEFGAIWFPSRVSRDWAPYRHGRWDYVRPWGWTWIAEEPWGYAPYHYGRWVYVRNRWGWYPGERVANPVWAPALVAWVGGSNFSIGISSGRAPAMGWYPLAPWERYEPWYRTNTTYVTRVNRMVVERPPRQYRDRDRNEWRYANRDRGATVVRREAFTSGRSINQAIVQVTPEAIRQAQPAPATTVLPGREEFRRSPRVATQPPVMQPGAPTSAQAPRPQPQQSERTFRRGDRAPAEKPTFERREAARAPAPATAAQQRQPARQAPAQAPGKSPIARDDERTRERAAREQQQAQERAAREAQQQQRQAQPGQPAAAPGKSPIGRDDQRTQERAAREQQQAQERAQKEQQQAQERAQREAQQAQQRAAQQQQQQQQQQRQAQEKAQREAQQAQERAAKEAQQAQQRAAQQQQQQQQQRQAQEKAQREAQQAQQRAAKEAQQAQQRAAREAQQRAAKQPPPPQAAPQAAPQAPPPQAASPAKAKPEGKGRGRDKEDKEKEKEDEEKEKGRGKGR